MRQNPNDRALDSFKAAMQKRAEGRLQEADILTGESIAIFQQVDGANSPDAANLLNVRAALREEVLAMVSLET